MDRRDYADLLRDLPRRRDQLLPALHLAHAAHGWLPEAAIEAVADLTAVPLSELYGIITSYSELRLRPPHDPHVEVCIGLSCLMAGARSLVDAAAGRGVIVEPVACRFLCGVAPVANIGGRYFSRLTLGRRFENVLVPATGGDA